MTMISLTTSNTKASIHNTTAVPRYSDLQSPTNKINLLPCSVWMILVLLGGKILDVFFSRMYTFTMYSVYGSSPENVYVWKENSWVLNTTFYSFIIRPKFFLTHFSNYDLFQLLG